MKRTKHTFQNDMEGKVCSKCHEWRPLEQYYNTHNTWDGKTWRCKRCAKRINTARYVRERDRILAQVKEFNKEWRSAHPDYWKRPARREANRRRRARTKAFEAIESIEWLDTLTVFDNRCAYCGRDGALEQDHVVPVSRGGRHTIDNLVPACVSCNTSKKDSDFLIWYKKQRFFNSTRLRLIQSVVKGRDAYEQ